MNLRTSDINKQLALINRGVEEVLPKNSLSKLLKKSIKSIFSQRHIGDKIISPEVYLHKY